MMASVLPPMYPETSPNIMPVIAANATLTKPTAKEMRDPYSIAEYKSRP